MICPDCYRRMDKKADWIYYCPICDSNYHIEALDSTRSHQVIPELKEGTIIYVNNKEHKYHLEIGKILERDHRHYRIQIDNKAIWVPEHWVEPLPKELNGNV